MHVVVAEGACRLPGFYEANKLPDLQAKFANLAWEYVHRTGAVQEDFLKPVANIPKSTQFAIDGAAAEIWQWVESAADEYPSLWGWTPNDISVQKYYQEFGVSSHKDFADNFGVIVVLSIQGEAIFHTYLTRPGEVMHEWKVNAGDLVVLRAPGLIEMDKDSARLYHSISGALDEPRISLGFRDWRPESGQSG